MELWSVIVHLFAARRNAATPYFGKINPNDLSSYVRADHEIGRAERQDRQTHGIALEKWGFKSPSQWSHASGAILLRARQHGRSQDLMQARHDLAREEEWATPEPRLLRNPMVGSR